MTPSQLIERQGFWIARSVLNKEQITSLGAEVAKLEQATARNLLAIESFAELACSPLLRDLVEPFLGSGAFAVRGLLFDKRDDANWGVAWHQDTVIPVADRPPVSPEVFVTWSQKDGVHHVRPPAEILERMITVRLALDEANGTNGALRVAPGLHKKGLLDNSTLLAHIREEETVLCETQAGDAS